MTLNKKIQNKPLNKQKNTPQNKNSKNAKMNKEK